MPGTFIWIAFQNDDYEEEMEEKEPEVEPQSIDWCEGLDLPTWVAQADCVARFVL